MRVFASLLMLIVFGWIIFGGVFAFLGYLARQGLAAGSNKTVQEITLRQERWAGRAAAMMYRRLWPVPVAALIGLIVIAATRAGAFKLVSVA